MKRRISLVESAPVKYLRKVGSTSEFFPKVPSNPNDIPAALASLTIAAQKGYLDIVMYHLENSAKDYKTQVFGPLRRNLLHLAAGSGNVKLIKYLIDDNFANLFAKDELDCTPFDLASDEGKKIIQREISWAKRKPIIFCYKFTAKIPLPIGLFRHLCSYIN